MPSEKIVELRSESKFPHTDGKEPDFRLIETVSKDRVSFYVEIQQEYNDGFIASQNVLRKLLSQDERRYKVTFVRRHHDRASHWSFPSKAFS